MSLFEAHGVVKRFGGLTAVDRMWLEVEPGQIVALIGPNGAGKTTLFNCLTGLLTPDEGRIVLDGHELSGLDVDERARLGLGRTFQRLEVFAGLTVRENLQVAVEATQPPRMFRELFTVRTHVDDEVVARTNEIIEIVGLDDVADVPAGDLSTGTLRMVELARAMCTEPKVVLLDEPASGLDTGETRVMRDLLLRLAADGMGVLLVEHDVDLVMEVSDRVFVMDFGRFVADGPPGEVRENPDVIAAYLGVDEAEGADTTEDRSDEATAELDRVGGEG